MAVLTVLCIGLVAVFTRGMIQRLLILVGLIVACGLYALLANVFGLGKRSILPYCTRRRGSGCRTLPPRPLTVRR
jgi:putative pyrimidine permease RutG